MTQQSDTIITDINAYLLQHERMDLLKLLTCGSVDDGKSTLIGRLLYDTKMIYEDQLASIKSDSVATDSELELSLLVDGLQAEREQGITIDVAYRYFSTAQRKFIIADTPGHEQYTRNMATGASNSDLAIILIDARHGVKVQTRRHSFICSLLGIKHIIVAINKMDMIDFEQQVFDEIRRDFLEFSADLKFTDVKFIPIAALQGDNVVYASDNMPWYSGDTLMSMLQHVQITGDYNDHDLRFPVQYVNRPNADFRGFCGTLGSGIIRKGDAVTVLPSGKTTVIKSIIDGHEELEQAHAPMSITLTLEDEIDISRGDMLVHSNNIPAIREKFTATIVWMDEQAMLPGKQYDIKHACSYVSGQISSLQYKIDINTFKETLAPTLHLNEIGRCELSLAQAICVDNYRSNKNTGSFILIDRLSNATVGAGMILGIEENHQVPIQQSSIAHVTVEERTARYGQQAVTVLLTGLSGAGKTTIAHALERRLFDMGRISAVLDGKTMRLGMSSDLPRDQQGRIENLRRGAYVAKQLNDSGLICLAAFVAPEQGAREHAAQIIGHDSCLIVYLDATMEVCRKRDPSGLYAAEEGNITGELPGVSFPYEVPENAHLVLATAQQPVADCVTKIIAMLQQHKVI